MRRFPGLQIALPVSLNGVAVRPMRRTLGLMTFMSLRKVRYIPSPSGAMRWHSSTMTRSKRPRSQALLYTDCIPATMTDSRVSRVDWIHPEKANGQGILLDIKIGK